MKHISLQDLKDQPVSHNAAIRKKVMLAPGEVPHLTNFSQAVFTPGQVATAHSHADMYEIFFVSEGSGTMVVNNSVLPLRPGTCILVEPGDSHEVANTGQELLVLTYFGLV